jgi:hypothetical protein
MERCMLLGPGMRVLPDTGPRPRLLNSAVMSPPPTAEVTEKSGSAATGSRVRRFIIRVVFVAVMAAAVGFWATRPDSIYENAAAIRKLVAVGTRMVSSGTHPTNPPRPIIVQLNSDMVQVTSIALGHPRLAVINGKQVAEGDRITVHTPTRSIAITLRVLEISDRQVRLSDGTQVITAHLSRFNDDVH